MREAQLAKTDSLFDRGSLYVAVYGDGDQCKERFIHQLSGFDVKPQQMLYPHYRDGLCTSYARFNSTQLTLMNVQHKSLPAEPKELSDLVLRSRLPGLHGALVVVDPTSLQSLEYATNLVQRFSQAHPEVPLVLVKVNHVPEWKHAVTIDGLESLAEEYGIPFLNAPADHGQEVLEKLQDAVTMKVALEKAQRLFSEQTRSAGIDLERAYELLTTFPVAYDRVKKLKFALEVYSKEYWSTLPVCTYGDKDQYSRFGLLKLMCREAANVWIRPSNIEFLLELADLIIECQNFGPNRRQCLKQHEAKPFIDKLYAYYMSKAKRSSGDECLAHLKQAVKFTHGNEGYFAAFKYLVALDEGYEIGIPDLKTVLQDQKKDILYRYVELTRPEERRLVHFDYMRGIHFVERCLAKLAAGKNNEASVYFSLAFRIYQDHAHEPTLEKTSLKFLISFKELLVGKYSETIHAMLGTEVYQTCLELLSDINFMCVQAHEKLARIYYLKECDYDKTKQWKEYRQARLEILYRCLHAFQMSGGRGMREVQAPAEKHYTLYDKVLREFWDLYHDRPSCGLVGATELDKDERAFLSDAFFIAHSLKCPPESKHARIDLFISQYSVAHRLLEYFGKHDDEERQIFIVQALFDIYTDMRSEGRPIHRDLSQRSVDTFCEDFQVFCLDKLSLEDAAVRQVVADFSPTSDHFIRAHLALGHFYLSQLHEGFEVTGEYSEVYRANLIRAAYHFSLVSRDHKREFHSTLKILKCVLFNESTDGQIIGQLEDKEIPDDLILMYFTLLRLSFGLEVYQEMVNQCVPSLYFLKDQVKQCDIKPFEVVAEIESAAEEDEDSSGVQSEPVTPLEIMKAQLIQSAAEWKLICAPVEESVSDQDVLSSTPAASVAVPAPVVSAAPVVSNLPTGNNLPIGKIIFASVVIGLILAGVAIGLSMGAGLSAVTFLAVLFGKTISLPTLAIGLIDAAIGFAVGGLISFGVGVMIADEANTQKILSAKDSSQAVPGTNVQFPGGEADQQPEPGAGYASPFAVPTEESASREQNPASQEHALDFTGV